MNSSFCGNYSYAEDADNGDLDRDRNGGGAIVFNDQITDVPHQYNVSNCTFVDNRATTLLGETFEFQSEGGAIFLTRGDNTQASSVAEVHLTDCAFYANSIETGIEHYESNTGSIVLNGTIVEEDEFEIDLGPDLEDCLSEDIELDVFFPAATYEWSDGTTESSIVASEPGDYWVKVTLGSCTRSDTINIAGASIEVDLGADISICENSVLLDSGYEDGQVLWSDDSTGGTLLVEESGTYSVEVEVDGCTASDEIEVVLGVEIDIDLGPDISVCEESVLLDSGYADGQVVWSDDSTAGTLLVEESGIYSVEVEIDGCTASDEIEVQLGGAIEVDLGPNLVICPGESITLDASMEGASYEWQDGSEAATFELSAAGVYEVTVDVNGCEGSDAVVVEEIAFPLLNYPDHLLFCLQEEVDLILLLVDQFDNPVDVSSYSLLWQDGSTASTLLVDSPGTYFVDISQDACTQRRAVEVSTFDCEVLAIELLSFSGEAVEEGHALQWSTALETAQHLFQLQRSFDAQSFETIYTAPAIGNGANRYEFLNVEAVGPAYYRLLLDGELSSSVIRVGSAAVEDGPKLHPNPFTDFLYLELPQNAAEGQLRIYSSTGAMVLEKQIVNGIDVIDMDKVHAGIYIAELWYHDQHLVERWKLIKD